MVKLSDLMKLMLVIQITGICCAMPLGEEGNYESGVSVTGSKAGRVNQRIIPQFDQEIAGWIPVPQSFIASGYWPMTSYSSHNYPSLNERARPWAAPPKRNSELINSLLGLPKNMESAGK
jgi:Pigment-dispersing hormone (PDH)